MAEVKENACRTIRFGEYTLIHNTNHADPETVSAALAELKGMQGRKIAVLGDMQGFGDYTQAEHYKVGRIAAENVDVVYAYGPNSKRVLLGCVTGGMPENRAKAFTDADRLVSVLKQFVKSGDVILFMGSCQMHMELILEKFREEEK